MNLPEKEFFLQRCADFFDKLASESADVGLVPIVTAFDGRAEFDERHGRKWAPREKMDAVNGTIHIIYPLLSPSTRRPRPRRLAPTPRRPLRAAPLAPFRSPPTRTPPSPPPPTPTKTASFPRFLEDVQNQIPAVHLDGPQKPCTEPAPTSHQSVARVPRSPHENGSAKRHRIIIHQRPQARHPPLDAHAQNPRPIWHHDRLRIMHTNRKLPNRFHFSPFSL